MDAAASVRCQILLHNQSNEDNALVVVITNMECKNKNEISLSWIYSVSCVVNLASYKNGKSVFNMH